MAETPLFDLLIQRLATTDDPAAKAAIIAEIAFDQLPPPVATVARRCIILRWFDAAIVAALLPEGATLGAADVATQLAALPFVEKLDWGGLAYHDQTRSGLLARYATEQSDLLQQAAALAAAAYESHADSKLAGPEVLFCLIVAGQSDEAGQQLGRLLDALRSRGDWHGLLALFTTRDQAERLPFVTPLQRTASQYYARGDTLRRLGKPEEAQADYLQAISLDEKYAQPWHGLGVVYRNLKQYEEAIAAYQQAITRNEKYAQPWNGLGNVYSELKRHDESIAAYQQAIARNEKYATPWDNLGNVYFELKRYEEAIAAYQQAIARNEKYATPWNGLGDVYSELKRHDEAIAAYLQAIVRNEKFAAPWNNLGLVYYDINRHDEAIVAFQQAIALNDTDVNPHGNLSLVLRHLERWTEATAALQRAVGIDPARWVDWVGLAGAARRHGDEAAWQVALVQAQPLVDYTDLYNAACFESVAGNVDRALELLAQAAAQGQLDPDWAQRDPDLHWLRHDSRFWALVGELPT